MGKHRAVSNTHPIRQNAKRYGLAVDAIKLAHTIEQKSETVKRLETSDPKSVRAKFIRSDIAKLKKQLEALRKINKN